MASASRNLGTVREINLWFYLGSVALFKVPFRSWVIEPALHPFAKPTTLLRVAPEKIDALALFGEPARAGLPMRRLALSGGCLRYISARYKRSYIDVRGTFTQYLAKFSGRSRANRAREVKRFAMINQGALQWKEFRRTDEMIPFHRLACEVSQRSRQGKLYNAGVSASEKFQDHLVEAAARDEVRGYVLFDGDKPAAFNLCRVAGDVLCGELMGFDSAYEKLSPGSVLLYIVLQNLFTRAEFRRFDFGQGDGHRYKDYYATDSYDCIDVYYIRPSLRNCTTVGGHLVFTMVRELTARLLGRFGAKEVVRRYLETVVRRERRQTS